MSAIDSKANVKIGNFPFVLSQLVRAGRHAYSREEAPSFVNKFSSGEPNYRDSTFFPHWVQANWQNGFDQEFFDDGGKFYRSQNLDITNVSKLTIERAFSSAGLTTASVSVTAQEAWISSSQQTVTLTPSADSIIYSDSPTNNYGTNANLQVGEYNASVSVSRSLIKFDVSSLAGQTITSATLRLYNTGVDATNNARTMYANRMVRAWTENGVTWNKYDGTNNWTTAGGMTNAADVELANIGTVSVTNPPTAGWHEITLTTAAIQAWIDGTYTNNGLGISMGTETDDMQEFHSRENSNPPQLVIVYTPGVTVSTHMVGTSEGKIYSWDGGSTYTELFDTRRLEWFETGTDADKIIGDTGGTETAQSQGFQVDATCKMKSAQVYIKKNAGTPGNITCRVETNNAGVPSGTLVDANATATITSFSTSTYAWVTVNFPAAFTLTGLTTYHLVLKTAAAANDNNYAWAADGSSPGYSAGAMSASTDGGTTWGAVSAADAYFRILGNTTSVNCMLYTDLSGNSKLYIGVGDPEGTTAGDARLYSYDGTNFALTKIFASTNEATIGAMCEYGSTTRTVYIGLGSKAKIYSTTDFTTFTLAKTITVPRNPGYVLAMAEYNNKLYVGGGFQENLPGDNNQFNGFLYSYDEFSWVNVFPFDHTVITSLETYDTLLFIGTIKKRLYVFNTASIDKLLDFPWDVTIKDMIKWDDKLVLAVTTRSGGSATGNEAVYIFDRSGFHNAFYVTDKELTSLGVFNNNLMVGTDDGYVYKTSFTTYQSTGYLQTSYDEASLPSIYKIRRSVTLMYEALPTGCTIAISYKTDESDGSWTSLGTASTVGSTEATFNFSSGVYSKKISYKVTLATSVPESTPTLKKIIHKYVLSPDFKYMWKMKLLCADNIVWQDGTEPVALLNSSVSANATSITLKSSDDATPTAGFPDPSGSTMYASVINPSTGAVDRFSYTGKTATTLTGIPSSGTYALTSHDAGDPVKILGADFHQIILDLKQTRQLYTFTDIDSLTYTVLFHSYQADVWSINQDDYTGGLENEVPITLLEG